MRIIDWLGDFLDCSIVAEMQTVLSRYNCEYVDLVCKVPKPQEIIMMGFQKHDPDTELLPHLFEPYVRSNEPVRYAVKSSVMPYHIFKGDGDLDRPNTMRSTNNVV